MYMFFTLSHGLCLQVFDLDSWEDFFFPLGLSFSISSFGIDLLVLCLWRFIFSQWIIKTIISHDLICFANVSLKFYSCFYFSACMVISWFVLYYVEDDMFQGE